MNVKLNKKKMVVIVQYGSLLYEPGTLQTQESEELPEGKQAWNFGLYY